MALIHSSNAVLAKARAMFGRRLVSNDYRILCECKDVSSIALYLKSNTHYSRYIKSSNEKNVHRGQLESLLKSAYFEECFALCRYEITIGDFLYRYIIDTSEIDILMHFLTLLSSGKTHEYIYTMPVYMNKHSIVDIKALSTVKTYDDFLISVKDTPYYNIFLKNKPNSNVYDFAKIECEVYNEMYKNVFYMIEKNTHGKEKIELLDLFGSLLNAKNLDFILRLKKFFPDSLQRIYNLLCPYGTFSKSQLDELINAQSKNELLKILSRSTQGKELLKYYDDGHETTAKLIYQKALKNIRSSIYPSVVMISYLFLSEIELRNIVTTIEGVRYNVPSDVVNKLLIY